MKAAALTLLSLSACFSDDGVLDLTMVGVDSSRGSDLLPLDEHNVLVASGSYLGVLDLTDPAAPSSDIQWHADYEAWQVTAVGDEAWLSCAGATPGAELYTVPLDGPPWADLTPTWQLSWSERFGGMDSDGDLVALVGDRGLSLVDGHSREPLSRLTLDTDTSIVRLHHALALVITRSDGALVVDVSEPTAPEVLSELGRGDTHGVSVQDDDVWVSQAGRAEGYDLSDPLRPRWIGEVSTRGGALLRSGNVLVCSEGVWDVSTPSAPLQVARFTGEDGWTDLLRLGDLLVVSSLEGVGVVTDLPWEGQAG